MATRFSDSLCDSGIFDDDDNSSHSAITGGEVAGLAYNLPPRNVRRIAVECLQIRQIDVDHAKAISLNDSRKFAKECLHIWIKGYTGNNIREHLHNCLVSASEKGLLNGDLYKFLKSETIDHSQVHQILPHDKELDTKTKANDNVPDPKYKNDEITDQEISILAHKIPFLDIGRITLEFLHIPKIDIEHAEASCEGDAGVFATKCINLWVNRYSGTNMREDLLNCLQSASSEGLVNSTAYSFLSSHERKEAMKGGQEYDNPLKVKKPTLQISTYSEVDQNEITDVEISKLAYSVPPNQTRRIAIEFLNIQRITVEHAAGESGKNPWKFAYKCLIKWRNMYTGNNIRADLHRSLSVACYAGIIPGHSFAFLKTNIIPRMSPPDLSSDTPPSKIITDSPEITLPANVERDVFMFAVFCQLSTLLNDETMEETAVAIFGFQQQDFLLQKRLLSRRLMFLVLSSWWRAQQGNCASKKYHLLHRLNRIENRGLVPQKQLLQIVTQLGFENMTKTKSDSKFQDHESDQEAHQAEQISYKNYHLVGKYSFEDPTEELHQLAELFYRFEDVQDAAVNVFGFSADHIHTEIRMALEQLMFNVLCLWWRMQSGQYDTRIRRLIEKLREMESRKVAEALSFNQIIQTLHQEIANEPEEKVLKVSAPETVPTELTANQNRSMVRDPALN